MPTPDAGKLPFSMAQFSAVLAHLTVYEYSNIVLSRNMTSCAFFPACARDIGRKSTELPALAMAAITAQQV